MTAEDDATAGELALGVLDGEERAAATRRVLAEPAFARSVERWRDRFAALHADWPEVEPPPGMWDRIAHALPGSDGVSPGWRWATAAATALAAAFAGVLLLRPAPVVIQRVPVAIAAPAPLVAAIAPTTGKPFAAVFDRGAGRLRIAGRVPVATGRSAELWAIPADGVPRALGLLTRDAATELRLAATAAGYLRPGVTLAISIEPEGGSPKPTPTGPVVATGALQPV